MSECISLGIEGKNIVTAHPATASITYSEISSCIDKTITKIESEISGQLSLLPGPKAPLTS